MHVIWIQGWPCEAKGRGRWIGYFKDEEGWVKNKKTVFIFDEVQLTYEDRDLWHNFFKSIDSYDDRRAIAFASYGPMAAQPRTSP
jgi:hypothetical protein